MTVRSQVVLAALVVVANGAVSASYSYNASGLANTVVHNASAATR